MVDTDDRLYGSLRSFCNICSDAGNSFSCVTTKRNNPDAIGVNATTALIHLHNHGVSVGPLIVSWWDLIDCVAMGNDALVAKSLVELEDDPSTNMLADEGCLLMMAIRCGGARIVERLWAHCKANFLGERCRLESFDAMASAFFEVTDDWETIIAADACLTQITRAIADELNCMGNQRGRFFCESSMSGDSNESILR